MIFWVLIILTSYSWTVPEHDMHQESSQFKLFKVFFILTLLFVEFASCIRRWHDINRSGWWFLISFVPVVGWLVCLIANGFMKGTSGENDYGDDPLEDN